MQNAPVGALGLHESYASDQATIVESLVDRLNPDAATWRRGVDHTSAANINAYMAAIGGHHQVARRWIRDRHASRTLGSGNTRKTDAEIGEHILGEPRAIEALGRISPAKHIRNPLELKSVVDHLCALASCRHISDCAVGATAGSRTADLGGLTLTSRSLGLLASLLGPGLGVLLGLRLGRRNV